MTKAQTENNISQRIEKFACCDKDLLVLMTSSSFLSHHNLKIFSFKHLTKNNFNKQKILLLSHTKQFLDRGANSPPPPIPKDVKIARQILGKYDPAGWDP